jgi:hypothetical protein
VSVAAVNTAICKMLGVDATKARNVRLTLRPDAAPLVEVEQIELDPVIGPYRYELVPIGTAARLADLLALAHQYASECAECGGAGSVSVAVRDQSADFGRVPQRQACPDCADIRSVIDRAEGRT